ncbi:hypothetical protein DFH27DRAFT_657128 [Peziza echinospora]|nr:hypothetical protein DFH27DRAFT_657128 [Peziza echinospora]
MSGRRTTSQRRHEREARPSTDRSRERAGGGVLIAKQYKHQNTYKANPGRDTSYPRAQLQRAHQTLDDIDYDYDYDAEQYDEAGAQWTADVYRETNAGPVNVETIHFNPEPSFSDPLWLYPKTMIFAGVILGFLLGLLLPISGNRDTVWMFADPNTGGTLPPVPVVTQVLVKEEEGYWAKGEGEFTEAEPITTPELTPTTTTTTTGTYQF